MTKPFLAAGAISLASAARSWGKDGEAEIAAQAGRFANGNREKLPKLTLSAGEPHLKEGKLSRKSAMCCEIEIEADGSQEPAIAGPSLFHSIRADEIVISGIEVRPRGIDSIEFDEAGLAEFSLIAINPGTHALAGPGCETQKVEIVIE